MYRKAIRRCSYWKEQDQYLAETLFTGYNLTMKSDEAGEWLGFIGAI